MASGTWNVDASGNWSLATNWLSSVIADGATFTANFTNNITATRTVTLDASRSIGNLTFSDNGASGSSWVLANSGAAVLTLDNGVSSPAINVVTTTTISSTLAGTAGFTKAGNGNLTFTGAAKAISGPVEFTGSGTGYILLGVFNSGVCSQLQSIDSYTFNAPGRIEYNGNTAYIEDADLISGTSNGLVANYNTAGVTFSSPNLGSYAGGISGTVITASTTIVTTYSSSFPQGYLQAYAGAAGTVNHTYAGTSSVSSGTGTYYYIQPVGGAVTAILSNSSATSGVTLTWLHGVWLNAGSSASTFRTFVNLASNEIVVAGVISGTAATLSTSKGGAGKTIYSGANTYTGTTSIEAGTLAGNSTSAFGTNAGTTSVITQTGGTLEFGAVVNKGTNGVTLNSVGGADAVYAASGTTGLTCAGVALNAAATIFNIAGGTFTLTNSAAMSGTGFGLQKSGAGELSLVSAVANTFTGAVSVAAGTLTINAAATLGAGVSGVALTGTLKYAGTGAATISRSLTLTGSAPALEAAGTTSAAAVTFSAFTHAAGARTLTLKGSNTGNNTFSAALTDNGASVVSLTKQGAGKWILSAQPTYSGTTTVSEGELQFNGLNLNFDLTMNGTGVLSNTVIAGTSKTITCDGGTPEIVATTTGNTVTGTTSVTSGTLRLTTEQFASSKPVKVLGDTAVTVTSSLRTTVGTLQKGQMRYGGDLTFNNGSALYIG